ADVELPEGSSVRSVVAAGELLAASTVAPLSELEGRVVAIDVAGSVPSVVDSGSRVDVWAQPEQTGLDGDASSPQQIVDSAPRAHITRDVGSLGPGDVARIEVFVGPSDVSEVRADADGHSVLSATGAPTAPWAGGKR